MSAQSADDWWDARYMSASAADEWWITSNKNLSKDYVHRMQNERFEAFKEQDLERGLFDIAFEIEGKILHAHKFILAAVSEPMFVMLSDRWTTKDKPVKIECSSYDNFYQFLCFIYSGFCKINRGNAFQLIDMAECYAIPCLKEFCEKFLSDMRNTVRTMEEMYKVAVKYSLPKLLDSVKAFVSRNRCAVYKVENFITYEKPFVQFLSTIDRDPDDDLPYRRYSPEKESGFFESVYKWAEHQVMKQKPVNDENFNVEEAIKIEFEPILPNIKFSKMNLKFLMDFVLEKGFFLSPVELGKMFVNKVRPRFEENLFKFIYELAEKQALKKQMIAAKSGENLNITDSIKADLAMVIPSVEFHKMGLEFLINFVLEKGFLLSSDEFLEFFKELQSPKQYYFLNLRSQKHYDEEEFHSMCIYELAKKQALKKQMMAAKNGENFNVTDSIKADLAKVIPYIKFYKMDKKILMDFIVANQIITEEQASHVDDTVVEIKNGGKTISGVFKDDVIGLHKALGNKPCNIRCNTNMKLRFSNLKFSIPIIPSTVIKMEGVDWYLCLDRTGILTFEHHSTVKDSDYLLAEMKSDTEFKLNFNNMASLTVAHRNVCDL